MFKPSRHWREFSALGASVRIWSRTDVHYWGAHLQSWVRPTYSLPPSDISRLNIQEIEWTRQTTAKSQTFAEYNAAE